MEEGKNYKYSAREPALDKTLAQQIVERLREDRSIALRVRIRNKIFYPYGLEHFKSLEKRRPATTLPFEGRSMKWYEPDLPPALPRDNKTSSSADVDKYHSERPATAAQSLKTSRQQAHNSLPLGNGGGIAGKGEGGAGGDINVFSPMHNQQSSATTDDSSVTTPSVTTHQSHTSTRTISTQRPATTGSIMRRPTLLAFNNAQANLPDHFRPARHKTKCDLCLLHFPKQSVTGAITFKRVLDLRRRWGLEVQGRRSTAASFMYSKANLCMFCMQLFDVFSPDERTRDNSKKRPVIAPVEPKYSCLGPQPQARRPTDGTEPLDLALNQKVVMSSVLNDCRGGLVVNGRWQRENNVDCCAKTFTETEPWLEIDLGWTQPIKEVRILHRTEAGSEPRILYRMVPFWLMISRGSILESDLMDARESSLISFKIVRDEFVTTVEIPPELSEARIVRLQCEGFKSLQCAGVQVIKAEVEAADTRATSRDSSMSRQDSEGGSFRPGPSSSFGGTHRPKSSNSARVDSRESSYRPSSPFGAADDDAFFSCRPPSASSPTKPTTSQRGRKQESLDNHIADLVQETRKRYQEKELWTQKLARARSVYREMDVTRFTEIYMQLATEAAGGSLCEKIHLENLQVESTAIINKLLQLRQINVAIKEFLGDVSYTQSLQDAIANFCSRIQPTVNNTSIPQSLPTDYVQYLELLYMVRTKKVSMEGVEAIYAKVMEERAKEVKTQDVLPVWRPKSRGKAVSLQHDAARQRLISREDERYYDSLKLDMKRKETMFKTRQVKVESDPGLTGVVNYEGQDEARREQQKAFASIASSPDIKPWSPFRACPICLYDFPGNHSLPESISVRLLVYLLTEKLKVSADKYSTRLGFGMTKFDRIQICLFCSQFFDFDEEDGLAKSKCKIKQIGYHQYFDDRFPFVLEKDKKRLLEASLRRKHCCNRDGAHTPQQPLGQKNLTHKPPSSPTRVGPASSHCISTTEERGSEMRSTSPKGLLSSSVPPKLCAKASSSSSPKRRSMQAAAAAGGEGGGRNKTLRRSTQSKENPPKGEGEKGRGMKPLLFTTIHDVKMHKEIATTRADAVFSSKSRAVLRAPTLYIAEL